jgi:hypothetical protein
VAHGKLHRPHLSYRRDQQDPALLDGVVEVVRSGEKLAFHDSGELWRILVSTGRVPARRTSGSKRPAAATGAGKQALA